MEEQDFKDLWHNHNTNLQANLAVNYESIKAANLKSVRFQLNKLTVRRISEAIVFLFFAGLLITFCIRNYRIPQYAISGGILFIFSIVGALGNIRQIFLITRLDYSKPVTVFQIIIERIRAHSLQTLRLLFLSVPFYFAYIIIGARVIFGFDIYSNASSIWLLFNFILSLLLVPFSLWIFRQLRLNSRSNWVKKLIADNGGKEIDSAIAFIDEIVEYKNNEPVKD